MRGDILILLAHQNGVLALSPLSVVQPPGRILIFALEITRGKVVTRTEFASPAMAQGIEDKVATVEIAMRLVSLEFPRFHCHVQCIDIRPRTSERRPLITTVLKGMVKRKTIPKSTGDAWVIPKHAPGICCVGHIALVQRILRYIKLRRVKHNGIGRSGELVWAMVAIVERRRRSIRVHVVKASEVVAGIRGEKAEIGTSRGEKRRSHLSMTSGCEVPIIGGLVMCAIAGGCQHAISLRVVNCKT